MYERQTPVRKAEEVSDDDRVSKQKYVNVVYHWEGTLRKYKPQVFSQNTIIYNTSRVSKQSKSKVRCEGIL